MICIVHYYVRFFFFSSRRRHTRCSRDWSSDVCSSDLIDRDVERSSPQTEGEVFADQLASSSVWNPVVPSRSSLLLDGLEDGAMDQHEIGRASCRERV